VLVKLVRHVSIVSKFDEEPISLLDILNVLMIAEMLRLKMVSHIANHPAPFATKH